MGKVHSTEHKYSVTDTCTTKMLIVNAPRWYLESNAPSKITQQWVHAKHGQKLASLVQGMPSHTMPCAIHSYGQINNNPIDAQFDQLEVAWALFRDWHQLSRKFFNWTGSVRFSIAQVLEG